MSIATKHDDPATSTETTADVAHGEQCLTTVSADSDPREGNQARIVHVHVVVDRDSCRAVTLVLPGMRDPYRDTGVGQQACESPAFVALRKVDDGALIDT